MCDSGDNGKQRYFMGPYDSGDPQQVMTLESAIEDLRTWFSELSPGEEVTYRLIELSEAEYEALPKL